MSERWKELVTHPLWKDLFEAGDSVIAIERRALEERVRDVRVTDPVETMRFKAFLHGIEYVRLKAEQMAFAEPEEAPRPQIAPRTSPWLNRRIGG